MEDKKEGNDYCNDILNGEMSDNEDDVDFTSQAIRALRSTDKRGTLDDDSEPQLLNTSFEIKR